MMNKSFEMNYVDWTALVLVIVGALNWGLVGAGHFLTGGDWNLVSAIFGGIVAVEFGIYLLVGLAALYAIYVAYRLATSETIEIAEPELTEPEATERRTA